MPTGIGVKKLFPSQYRKILFKAKYTIILIPLVLNIDTSGGNI